jgi:NTP pyrophosphatase (non-canonical NTP hydrolase)
MSTQTLPDRQPKVVDVDTLRVVLCGSFRRDRASLDATFTALIAEFAVLSPASVDFVDSDVEFVRLADELDRSVLDIESNHLRSISEADFVWLHAPGGYVGASATLELGHARALGIPVFASERPNDETIAAFVEVVESPRDVVARLQTAPGTGLSALQSYYRRIAARRGWADESARDTMLLITEEVGELARAVRKSEGLARDGGFAGVDAAEELADVQLYLVHLANALGIDLATAVSNKEQLNAARHKSAA